VTISQPDETYWARLASGHFGPGWAKPEPSLWSEPRREYLVAHFSYDLARRALHEAGKFVSPAQAERRNLICVNPKEGNTYATTANLVAAYQMVGPGERARSHRHTPSALRLIIDAPEDAYTVVDGCRIDMAPGDVVLTPNWCWHGHANEGGGEAYWIDFLDVPFVQHTGPMFFEPYPQDYEPIRSRDPDSPLRISSASVVQTSAGDGPRIVPIADGLLSTMGLEVILVPAGCTLRGEQTTASSLYAAIDGLCEIIDDGGQRVCVQRGDIVAVPSWVGHELAAGADTRLLRVSDAPVLSALGLLKSARTRATSPVPARPGQS
jgi:gentisate 1,2-dioxygenase